MTAPLLQICAGFFGASLILVLAVAGVAKGVRAVVRRVRGRTGVEDTGSSRQVFL